MADSLSSSLRADTWRQFGRFSWRLVILGFLLRRNFRVCVTLRLSQAAASLAAFRFIVLPLARVLHRLASGAAAMDLPWNVEVGPGLALTHGWGLVVTAGARIGRNVTLFHGVTLGRRDRIGPHGERTAGFPTIEDEVWIGPHAIIVGQVRIGRGSRIGGGAMVTEDVPPFCVVAGNPSRIVRQGCTPDVMNPAP